MSKIDEYIAKRISIVIILLENILLENIKKKTNRCRLPLRSGISVINLA